MHLSYGNRLCLYLQDGYRRAPVRRVDARLAAIAADLQPDRDLQPDQPERDSTLSPVIANRIIWGYYS
jgi:hypothetical protein